MQIYEGLCEIVSLQLRLLTSSTFWVQPKQVERYRK